jgi:hypothetical protein
MKQLSFLYFTVVLPFISICQDLPKQKLIGITASLPWVNNYRYYDHDLNKPSSKTGFVGLGIAAFYKTGKNKYSLNCSFHNDLPAPVGAFDYSQEGTRTNILSTVMEALYTKNLFNRINIIAGINYVRYRFNLTSYVNGLPSYSNLDRTAGLTIGTGYYFSKNSCLALLYRPAIISFDKNQYWHLISLHLRFDFSLWKRN